MSNEYDLIFAELNNATETRRLATEKAQSDKNLSPAGKQSALDKIEFEYGPKFLDIESRFHRMTDEQTVTENKIVAGKPKQQSYVKKVRDAARRDSSVTTDYVSDTIESAGIIESIQSLEEMISQSTYQSLIGGLGKEQFSIAHSAARDSGDIKKLGWIRGLYDMRGESGHAKAIDAEIEMIKDTHDPARALAKKRLENIELQKKYFQHSLGTAKRDHEVVDLRGGESEQALKREIYILLKKVKEKD